jgi:exopolyphosphatase/pppGpp-phosphohydrolase
MTALSRGKRMIVVGGIVRVGSVYAELQSHPERPRFLRTPIDDRSRNLASDQYGVLRDKERREHEKIDHRRYRHQQALHHTEIELPHFHFKLAQRQPTRKM